MAAISREIVQNIDLSASKAVRVKKQGDPYSFEISPEICFCSLSSFTFARDFLVAYQVGDLIDLHLVLNDRSYQFSGRIISSTTDGVGSEPCRGNFCLQ